jgi:AraC family transcriptional regulator of arabinose operon
MIIAYNVDRIKHEGLEKKGFILDRPHGTDDFLFIHFKTPVNITINNETTPVSAGGCVIFTPTTGHNIESPDCDLVHDWIHFIPNNIEDFLKLELPINQIFYPPRVHFITPAIMTCEIEYINKETYWIEAISSALTYFFINLKREVIQEKTLELTNYMIQLQEDFKKLRLTLYGQVDKNWNIEKMAFELSLSRSRFTVLYKKFFNISPTEDLIIARITRAKHLLENSNLTLNQVSQMSGYTNIYHFIRQFKKATGAPPGIFRYVKNPL